MLSSILALAAAAMTPAGGLETAIEAPGPKGALRGTMLRPAGGGPMLLVIPGSGPTDRNGNNPLGINAAPYRLLAEALVKEDIGTVRIDKRGMFGSAAAVDDPNAVTIEQYAADAQAWVKAVRKAAQVPCVWLLGHSEGALVALAAARTREDICGLILVSAPGRPLGTVMREQLKANPANAPLLDQAFAAIDRLEAGETFDPSNLHPALAPLFAAGLQPFLISLFSQKPAQLAAAASGMPMLIVQGDQDVQVGVADARHLAEANPKATMAILPGVNHVLKVVEGRDRSANLATYADPALPIAPSVVTTISSFVRTQAP